MHMSAQGIRSLALSSVPVLAVVVLTCALLASDPRVARAGDDGIAGGKVALHITETGNADSSDGSLGGVGRFTISGAVSDSGTTAAYRTEKPATVLIRRVMVGKKGTFSLLLTIYKARGVKLWTITSGTGPTPAFMAGAPRILRSSPATTVCFVAHRQCRTRQPGTPQWLKAMDARGDALNRKYRLGKYARNTSVVTGGLEDHGANRGHERRPRRRRRKPRGHRPLHRPRAPSRTSGKCTRLPHEEGRSGSSFATSPSARRERSRSWSRSTRTLGTSRWTIASGTKAYKGSPRQRHRERERATTQLAP